jgi:hypothetical protein
MVTLENPSPGLSAVPLTIAKGKGEGQLMITVAADAPLGPVTLRLVGTAKVGERELRAVSHASETYNIQGTAFQRDLPLLVGLITEK